MLSVWCMPVQMLRRRTIGCSSHRVPLTCKQLVISQRPGANRLLTHKTVCCVYLYRLQSEILLCEEKTSCVQSNHHPVIGDRVSNKHCIHINHSHRHCTWQAILTARHASSQMPFMSPRETCQDLSRVLTHAPFCSFTIPQQCRPLATNAENNRTTPLVSFATQGLGTYLDATMHKDVQ